MPKTQLHQILAVEASVNSKSTKLMNDMIATFSKKANHFIGQFRRYTKITEDDGTTQYPNEDKHVATTVAKELDIIKKSLINSLDVSYQKEATNAIAVADISVNGIVIAEKVPVTFLLNLETKLNNIKKALSYIPTLDNGVEWKVSDGNKNISETLPVTTFKTSKAESFEVITPATKEHRAQYEKLTKDINIGTWNTTKRSGQYPTEVKAQLLSKVDDLITAVKRARAKANQQEVLTTKIGSKIINHIFS